MINTEYLDTLEEIDVSPSSAQRVRALSAQAARALVEAEVEIDNCQRFPTRVGIHYEQALWKYREAICKFEQARQISTSPLLRKSIDFRIRECLRRAREVGSLQHKTGSKHFI